MRSACFKNVRILTALRQNDGPCRCSPRLQMPVAVLLAFVAMGGQAETLRWQPVDDIRKTAEAYLRERIGASAFETGSRTSVRAGALDERHRLAKCDAPLEPFMRRGERIAARTIVGVRCAGSKPWKVYVPVDVITLADVVIAIGALPRGHVITAADLASDQRDVSRKIKGYFSNPADLVGQRLKHQVISGRVITPGMLEANDIIQRGQAVTLTVNSSGINVTMAGTALMDGALNQRIRVENRKSGRVVEGVVRSREHVEIIVPPKDAFFNAKPKVSPQLADTQLSNNDR